MVACQQTMEMISNESSLKYGRRQDEGVPEAKYTRFGEKIRQAIPGPMQCSMACGGRNCKWENPSRWSEEDQVVKGVFSSWVLEDVVAMSRPSTEVIKKYDLIKQFKESNICSIINLQRPGEHASCGPPLHKESQFTYIPQTFMDNDIFFYNFGWKDYGVTSLDTILDMVKVMTYALSEGKVAVHCHAGLGRTGVLIACYLVYAHRMDASSAINTVRKRRPNSIQTRGQIACIQEFAQFLKPLRIVFPQVVPRAERLTLVQFLHRQRHLLHGFESRELRYIPKIVQLVCQRLVQIATTSNDADFCIVRGRASTGSKPRSGKRTKKGQLKRSNTIATLKETLPGAFVNEHLETRDTLLDPMDSQVINALLSPRFYRRSDSAKSKTSSSSKSLSGPGSPVMSSHSMDDDKEQKSPESDQSKLVMVESMKDFSCIPTPEPEISSKPQVMLVKQGSRSALLPAATNIIQSSSNADVNLNNNNQVVPSCSNMSSVSVTQNSIDQSVIICNKKSSNCDSPSIQINTSTDDTIIKKNYDLPSPTPSNREPSVHTNDRKSQEVQGSSGEKPAVDKYRSSAGRSQRILPTGMPLRSRTGSGKGKKKPLFVDDTDEVEKNEEGTEGNTEEKIEQENIESLDNVETELSAPESDSETKEETKEEIEPEVVENPEIIPTEEEALDRELDEIIEMKDDDGPFLSDSDSEQEIEDGNGQNDNDEPLSHSIASRVSWSAQMNEQDVNNKEKSDTSNTTECVEQNQDISKTQITEDSDIPLVSRGDKSMEPIEDVDQDAVLITRTSPPNEEDSTQNSENKEKKNEQLEKVVSQDVKIKARRKNKMQEKPIGLPVHKLTQSLCDLRAYDDLSRDVFVQMSDETKQLPVPLSPSSKSSSSDDVRTPSGSATRKRIKDPITVAMALAYKLTDNEWLWEKVYTRQVELNTREGAWSSVEQEVDAHLLSCLMWSWIEHLSQPILTSAEIDKLILLSRPEHERSTTATECPDPVLFENALAGLGKHTSCTFQCILRCLLSLPPLSFELETSVVRRVMSAFTQSYLLEDESEDSAASSKFRQLVTLVQNYLVKTRAREQKKHANVRLGRKEIESSNKTHKPNEESSNEGSNESEITKDNQEGETDVESKFVQDEGSNSSSTSSVVELQPRIAVS